MVGAGGVAGAGGIGGALGAGGVLGAGGGLLGTVGVLGAGSGRYPRKSIHQSSGSGAPGCALPLTTEPPSPARR